MLLSKYNKERIKEQMEYFNEFVQVVHDEFGCDTYSMDTIATLYMVIKKEMSREDRGYSSY